MVKASDVAFRFLRCSLLAALACTLVLSEAPDVSLADVQGLPLARSNNAAIRKHEAASVGATGLMRREAADLKHSDTASLADEHAAMHTNDEDDTMAMIASLNSTDFNAKQQKQMEATEQAIKSYDDDEKQMMHDTDMLLKQSALEKEDAQRLTKSEDEDIDVFKMADTNNNSHLEEHELDHLMDKSRIHKDDFDWRSFDHDKDGRLSRDEFLKAGPAAAKASSPFGLSLLEEHVFAHRGAAALVKIRSFKDYDENGSGSLEDLEAEKLMADAGLDHKMWHNFDLDGDGVISQAEFEHTEDVAPSMSALDQGGATNDAVTADQAIFDSADTNNSTFLEEPEIKPVLAQVGINETQFDWRQFDKDKDGRLSETEFLSAGPAAAQAAKTAFLQRQGSTAPGNDPSALVDEGFGDQDTDEDDAGDQLDQRVMEDFKKADTDGSGFLEQHEIKAFAKEVGFPDTFDWNSYDTDGDGKFSYSELRKLAAGNENAKDEADDDDEDDHFAHEDDDDEPSFLEDEDHDEDEEGDFSDHEDDHESLDEEDEHADDFDSEAAKEDFNAADEDKSGFLEPSEVEMLTKRIGAPSSIEKRWHSFDKDSDGKLNQDELVALVQAATHQQEQDDDQLDDLLEKERGNHAHDSDGIEVKSHSQ